MIEIALCLAIIGFALVAIIGILPFGLSTQRENREETIIDQDATVWMDAIRNGARGFDDLTNYVIAITNIQTYWQVTPTSTNPAPQPNPNTYIFTRTSYTVNGTTVTPPAQGFYLTNGLQIIGLLSKPKIEWKGANLFYSNNIVANVRAISGSAVEKAPQDNDQILADAFSYRMIPEIVPYVPFDPNSTNFNAPFTNGMSFQQLVARTNYTLVMSNLQANLHDLRLTFRWPLLPNGNAGNYRQTFRAMAGGQMATWITNGHQVYFFQPSLYTNTP
jgi:hypothetical protein